MILKEQFGYINTVWAKYSDYKLVHKNGMDFVKPTASSTIQIYNMDEVSTDFLIDAINTGKGIYEKTKEYKKETVKFIQKYGIFGWITYLPVDTWFYHEESVYLGKNKGYFENQLFFPTEEYIFFLMMIRN